MVNEGWNYLPQDFWMGIMAFKMVDLRITFTLDGFGSNLKLQALEVFLMYKILLAKEDTNTYAFQP